MIVLLLALLSATAVTAAENATDSWWRGHTAGPRHTGNLRRIEGCVPTGTGWALDVAKTSERNIALLLLPSTVALALPASAHGPAPARNGGIRFAPNEEPGMTYGLTIIPPWDGGGTLHVNFPEHFEYGEPGYGILRHHNKVPYPWQIAPDGRAARFEVESPELPGAIVRASAVAAGDMARLSLKLVNRSNKRLERVKPLLCFWYAKLAGFPGRQADNFTHTYVVIEGKPTALAHIPTSNPAATAKVAYVRGCTQRDCDKFAISRGGLIGRDVDRALIVVEARDGKRKLVITFTPGKSILSNASIPCAHADPLFGTVEPGAEAEVNGELLFTEKPVAALVQEILQR